MKVEKVQNIDMEILQKVMGSTKITDSQKIEFLRSNRAEIRNLLQLDITSSEFKGMMQNRPLQKFRPLKNSFTKRGDIALLAKALGINTSEVSGYIKNVSKNLEEINNLDFLPSETMEKLKTYVYRHGTKDELVNFLDYELQKSKDLTKSLYKTLEYYSGGVADYFLRPIHRMDNKTLIKIYHIINKNIKNSIASGEMSDVHGKKIAKWALIRIYQIQNNSKLINAIKTYKTLT